MKAIFGKISIGCFVAMWIACGILSLIKDPHSCPMGQPVMLMIFIAPVCLFLGFLLGIIGAIKDTPKWYAIVGLLLSLGYPVIGLLIAMVMAMGQ